MSNINVLGQKMEFTIGGKTPSDRRTDGTDDNISDFYF